jgi:predicted PurR-regulated permease PerM
MGEKHETLDHIREYLESREFEYKFKTWTTKTCKEVMAGYWKPMAAISSVFATIIGFMLAFIFGHFNHTIDKLQDTTSSLTQSVVRLEQTVEILYNEQNKQNTPHKLKSIGSI